MKPVMMWRYVIFTYLLFWFMVMALGGTAAMVLNASPLTQRIVQALCAWAPTFAFLIMFKRLRPNTRLKEFFVSVFSQKLRFDLLIVSGAAVVFSSLLPLLVLSFVHKQNFTSYFSLQGYSLPQAVLLSLFAGPLGEELGWRGYLRVELDTKYGFLKASLIGGVIWAFWHAILWFVDVAFLGGATGRPLAVYIISNVVVMTSLVIIMNIVLKRSNNLLHAIWIHFCFNILYVSLINIDERYFVLLTATYALAGLVFLLFHYGFPLKKHTSRGNLLRGCLLPLVLFGGAAGTAHPQAGEPAQTVDRGNMMIAPMGQYQYLETGSLDIHSTGGGLLIQREEKENSLTAMGFYTRHVFSGGLRQNDTEIFHKISGFAEWKHDRHRMITIVKSESDKPFVGGLGTFNAGLAYGYTWFEGQHYNLMLGGGLVVGEFGNLPSIPVPFIRYNLKYPLFETYFEFMTGPSLTFKVAPGHRFYGVAEISQEEFRNIRDLKFDVYVGYRLFTGQSKIGDIAGFNIGVKNQSLNFDNSRNDLDISAYVLYGNLDFEVLQITAGYAFAGQALFRNKDTQDLGSGYFVSVQALIPFGGGKN